jgi:hypothetical protein
VAFLDARDRPFSLILSPMTEAMRGYGLVLVVVGLVLLYLWWRGRSIEPPPPPPPDAN